MSDNRLDNFRLLYSVALLATQAEFGRVLNLTQSEVSNYNMSKTPIGDYLSRRIESEFKLPVGWMDRPNVNLMLTAQEYELLTKVRARKGNAAIALTQLLDGLSND